MQVRKRASQQRERGQVLVEFAAVMTILVILIFGFVDLTRVFNAWTTIEGAAREGARFGVTGQVSCTGITNNRLACIQYAAKERAKALTNSSTAVAVTVRSWKYPNYANPATQNDPGGPCDALEVQVNFTFKAATPLMSHILGSLHLTARERLVNEPFSTCG
jgi:Flp pilus assembly protein TadG